MRYFAFVCTTVMIGELFAKPNMGFVDEIFEASLRQSVEQTPIEGLSQFSFDSQVFYISEDGRYIIQGDMIDLKTQINLTEKARNDARVSAITDISPDDMIIFPAQGEAEDVLTIYTDIDCFYCRKIHREIEEYNALGMEVRYLPFPQDGFDSFSYNKAVSVWCSDDRQAALTQAMLGQAVEARDCNNSIDESYILGMKIGVYGTPAIILTDGTLIPGYVGAQRLKKRLQEK